VNLDVLKEPNMRISALAWVSVLIAAGCGGSSDTRPDAGAYAALAQSISSAATSYGSAAAATNDVAGCQSEHAAYDGRVRPMIERMQGMSGEMDREMAMMGTSRDADMTCGANALMAELDAHAAAACTSSSMAENHTEAMRHASAMETWATHQQQRAEEMGGMMGAGMGMGGTMTMACQHNADGTYTLVP
jgi:hypothetical protein